MSLVDWQGRDPRPGNARILSRYSQPVFEARVARALSAG